PYTGPPLRSRQRVDWTVRVWDETGAASEYAPGAWWEMGLLDPDDWQAAWIAPAERSPTPSAVSYLHTTIRLDASPTQARAYASALGLYELRCNGAKVGDGYLAPGWTDYNSRLHYQVLDLTDLLVAGDNHIEAVLADGWYAGWVGFVGQREHYGDTPQLLVQIETETAAGREVHSTGPEWHAGRGPIRTSDMLLGEVHDHRSAVDATAPVRLTDGTAARRLVSPGPPVRMLTELAPVSITDMGGGTHRIDLGQNMVGWLRLSLRGAPGATVTVRHAEILDADGSLYTENLRAAAATDSYVLASASAEICEPVFTFHGFRYAEVSGYDGTLSTDDVVGVVIGSDVPQAGTFACSNDRVNQLHSNIVWSARGNFLEVPTDCPQRDERLGWTGDAQVFVETACYITDAAAFYTKWLRDLVDAQSEDGGFPDVAPRIVDPADGAAGWADAGTIVPAVVAHRYGDLDLLIAAYPAMRAWVNYVHDANPGLLWLERRNNDMGDWLNVDAETDKDLIATAFFAHSTRRTAQAAATLGRVDDAVALHALADRIGEAFRAAYLLDGGRLKTETQSGYALALRFGLIPPADVSDATDNLVADIEAHNGHLTTGFLGVNHLLPALSLGGRHDVAYRLLLTGTYPSWLYSVEHGATTIWERWDGWTADGGFQNAGMNSFNHYAFGAVGEWLYRTAAGIGFDADVYGCRMLDIAPEPCDALEWVEATYNSVLGPIRSRWQRDGDAVTLDVDVPVGAEARVHLSTGIVRVGSGRHRFDAAS
ncbi:MAG: family 78 glycoside hydrolase catalytic domain, partial [Actinobacteria bacterium]|nr:family 78 glycoside hydrolase catalytic domain [Actinomycetota bacterium]